MGNFGKQKQAAISSLVALGYSEQEIAYIIYGAPHPGWKKAKRVQFNIRLPEVLIEWLDEVANDQKKSKTEIIESMLRLYGHLIGKIPPTTPR